MRQTKLLRLVTAAVFAALTCVATMIVNIPIPATKGYVNMGDCIVLLGAFFLGPVYGMAAGALGSMLSDVFLGYAQYAPGTLVIKGLMALCAALLFSYFKKITAPSRVDRVMWDHRLIPICKRKIAASVALSFLTAGLYLIYWEYLLVKNIRAIREDESDVTGEVLCLVFVPFYPLYWWFTRGRAVKDTFAEHGFSCAGNETAYLILGIFGLGIVSMAIMQNDLNSLPSETVVPADGLTRSDEKTEKNMLLFPAVFSALTAEFIMVTGYFAYESLLLGYGLAAAASIPANLLQAAGGLVLSALLFRALCAVPAIRRMTERKES